jgi:tRNA(fMet)-specific endonuclease VapC
MRYLLDTNICIFLIRKRSSIILTELRKHDPADLCISAITVAELEYGCDRSAAPEKNRLALTEFLSPFTLLSFDEAAACVYGKVRTGLEKVGTPIGAMDLLIASHAVSQQMIVVTNNTREFKRVKGLAVEDWSQ